VSGSPPINLRYSLPLILLAALGLPARATIVGTGTGTQNVTSPTDLSYFNNIGYHPFGSDTGGSVVYLGSNNGTYWAMSAGHVVGGNTIPLQWVFPNVGTFNSVENSYVNLNYQGVLTDITVFQIDPNNADIANLAALPPVHFGPQVSLGTQVTMVGMGRDRSPTLTHWKLADPSDPENTMWTVVANANQAQRHGYYYNLNSFSKRWSQNLVEPAVGNSPVGVFDLPNGVKITLFRTTFNQNGLANEGQVAPGDSGGGVFANNRMVGMPLYLADERHVISDQDPSYPLYNNQPNPPLGQPYISAVFGNDGYYANLPDYVDQIASITGLRPSIAGDANLDGVVDSADFKILNDHYGAAGGWMEGDFNLNGRIDFGDFQLLELNFGQLDTVTSTVTTTQSLAFANVPEPASLILLALGAPLLMRRRAL
jgi:hypothetical protein